MGFRFRRSVRLFPGVRINLSKSGASLTAGVRGAHINLSKTGVHETIGLPGTGLSYRTGNLAHKTGVPQATSAPKNASRLTKAFFVVAFIVLVSIIGSVIHH